MQIRCLVFVMFTIPSPAIAQDVVELPPIEALTSQCAPEVQDNRSTDLVRNGIAGVWLRAEVVRCMLTRLELLPHYARRVHLLDERLELTDARDALLRRQADLAGQEADAARGALEAAVRRAREAEDELDAWYRHPALWFAIGVVGIVALELVAVYLLHTLSP